MRYAHFVAHALVGHGGSQFLHADEMGVKTTAAYLVASRLGHQSPAVAGQQRTHEHDAAAQGRCLRGKILAFQGLQTDVGSGEFKRALVLVLMRAIHFHAYQTQQVYQFVDISDVGYILNGHRLAGEQHGAQHLQRLILGSLRGDFTIQAVAAYYLKRTHALFLLGCVSVPAWLFCASCASCQRTYR